MFRYLLTRINRYIGFLMMFVFVIMGYNTYASLEEGAKIFKQRCAACHKVGKGKLVGPGLYGSRERNSDEWLIKWVKNSQNLVKSGDKYAVKIFNEYNKVPMPPNEDLTDEQVKWIFDYVDAGGKLPSDKKVVSTDPNAWKDVDLMESQPGVPEKSNLTNYLLLIWLIITIIIYLTNKSYTIRAFFLLGFLAIGGKACWDSLLEIGISQGYQPTQPIKFSHKVHAGQNQIDCNYCHSTVEKGKSATVPSLNVCMNCHYVVNEGSKTGTVEISKIYKALDFNPETLEYGKNPKPIEWKRVYDLPDHVYFNHKQHVKVGKVNCQECHGPVQEMDEIYQYSEMTMGWCVECHRRKSVDVENKYYKDIHNKLTKEEQSLIKDNRMTVEKMGGLECSKCHY